MSDVRENVPFPFCRLKQSCCRPGWWAAIIYPKGGEPSGEQVARQTLLNGGRPQAARDGRAHELQRRLGIPQGLQLSLCCSCTPGAGAGEEDKHADRGGHPKAEAEASWS